MCCPGLSCVLIFLSVFFFFLCAGQGTFGKVKLAQNTESGIEYAIKILDKSDIKANELTVNVRREIAIMKALNHKNIVNLREVLSSRTKLYIVMDLVRGGELFEMIENRGELDEVLARKYFQQLIDGIDYCHRRGVCHRDLKKLAAEYEGKDMDVFVRDALPGKPSRKIDEVVRRLEEIDIDCVDDIQCVAETVQTPAKLTKWLEDESKMPSVTAMRITKMFFP
ncbi:hypothetical protein I4F81_003457 [Pyropia yezoensis]|uniref:Uncharacterized protein n=1 Tax=Pyropia yezoensis TaxID=2788 RepID=A0ACC3BTV3_PYRYE|nr:hypothetical protein I4F81_003457 [Neopyropia yezoensis]